MLVTKFDNNPLIGCRKNFKEKLLTDSRPQVMPFRPGELKKHTNNRPKGQSFKFKRHDTFSQSQELQIFLFDQIKLLVTTGKILYSK